MKRNLSLFLTAALMLVCLASLATAQVAAQAPAQNKPVDMKKLVAEIVGDYDFSFQGQSMLIQFTESDGKVLAAPVGETPEQINPVEGKSLCFDITRANGGQYYELQFVRNDKGVIDKCILNGMGVTIEGTKVIK
jgi:TolA-binding protein